MKTLLMTGFMVIFLSCQEKGSFTGDTDKLGQVPEVVAKEEPNPEDPIVATPTPEPAEPEVPQQVESEPFQQFELQFEDWNDFDFDIYFCALGEYRLTKDTTGYSRIESLISQTVQIESGKLTDFGCANQLLVKHTRNGELVQERLIDLRDDEDVYERLSFEMQPGDLIDPIFLVGPGALCDQDQTTGLEISMTDNQRSRIFYEQDQCKDQLCQCTFFNAETVSP